jgi:hypothetical protein
MSSGEKLLDKYKEFRIITYTLREVNEEFTFIYPKYFNFVFCENDFE